MVSLYQARCCFKVDLLLLKTDTIVSPYTKKQFDDDFEPRELHVLLISTKFSLKLLGQCLYVLACYEGQEDETKRTLEIRILYIHRFRE